MTNPPSQSVADALEAAGFDVLMFKSNSTNAQDDATRDALIALVRAAEKIAQPGSEQYEGTSDQVPRDHLAALVLMARYEADRALASLRAVLDGK